MKVAIPEPYHPNSIALLRAQKDIEVVDIGHEAVLVRSRTKIDKEYLDKHPQLKLVITATSGFDHIDWRECQARGITVSFTPDANAQSTAELTFALILAWTRDIMGARKNVREAKWREGLPRAPGLEGQTLAIIGLGRVGKKVAAMAKPFGMRVIAYDPYCPDSAFEETGAERVGLIEALKTGDFVSLHVPLTKETKYLLNNPTFGEMQAEAVLVNTCRGPVVAENDLLLALDEGTIAGACMDVIEREPPPRGHRLLVHPKLLMTPHIGAHTDSAWENASREAVAKLVQFQKGHKIEDTLPLAVPWFEKT